MNIGIMNNGIHGHFGRMHFLLGSTLIFYLYESSAILVQVLEALLIKVKKIRSLDVLNFIIKI